MEVVGEPGAALQADLRGVINVCNPERWARADIALALADAMALQRSSVKVISLYDIAAMKGRPLDTSMRISRLEREVHPLFTALREDSGRMAALWRRPA